MRSHQKILYGLGLVAVLGLTMGMGSRAPQVSFGSVRLAPGASMVHVPVQWDASDVSALQLEIQYDPAALVFQSVTEGPIIAAAKKQLTVNGTTPGTVIVVLLGLNQTPLPKGLLATLEFQVIAKQPTATTLAFKNVSAATGKGELIEVTPIEGRVTIK